jgi:hypothetical protein
MRQCASDYRNVLVAITDAAMIFTPGHFASVLMQRAERPKQGEPGKIHCGLLVAMLGGNGRGYATPRLTDPFR